MVYFKTAEGCPKLYQRTTEHLWVLLWELLPLSKHHQPDSWVILFYILLRRGGLSEWILCPRTQRAKKYIFFKALWDLKLRCFAALFPQKPGDEGVGLYLQPSFQVSGSQMANIAACCGIGYSLSSNRLHWVICYWIVMGHWLSLPIFFFFAYLCALCYFALFCFDFLFPLPFSLFYYGFCTFIIVTGALQNDVTWWSWRSIYVPYRSIFCTWQMYAVIYFSVCYNTLM